MRWWVWLASIWGMAVAFALLLLKAGQDDD
jgi:hypothetical protein